MKLALFSTGDGPRLGLVEGLLLFPIRDTDVSGRIDMRKVVQGQVTPDQLIADGAQAAIPFEQANLLPPLSDPSAIFCVGLNYAEHNREAPVKGTDYPTIFLRLPRNQIAHNAPMIAPMTSQTLDWEGELVAVVGKEGRHISPDHALDHVFGYSIYNDASVRGFQHHTSQFGMGKNFAGTGAFGPCIVTADAFGDPYVQEITTRIDGETVQHARQ